MIRAPGILLSLPCILVVSACADPSPPAQERMAQPEVGLSAQALERATAALQAHIDAGDIPGVVAAVARDGELVYLESLGVLDVDTGAPMPPDALFRIYSMTRPITALGILMLQEEGALDVADPVQRYLPEFADQPVLRTADSGPADARPRNGDITIAHLLTHTSGIGSRSSGLYTAANVHSYDQTLQQVVRNVAAVPLFEDPGTRFRYGMSAEVLGRVIEVVTGLPVDEFLRQRIFEPLGMDDTVFYVDEARRSRLATVHRRDAEGRLRPFEMEPIPVTEERTLTSSGVGLVSSTRDLLRFGQLFIDDGMVDGRRLISSETIRMASENWIPSDLLPLPGNGYWAGSGWSLGGFAVASNPDLYDHTVSAGEFWWDGSAGTRFWIDPAQRMVTIVMAQVSPAGGNGFREGFKNAVYDAIQQ